MIWVKKLCITPYTALSGKKLKLPVQLGLFRTCPKTIFESLSPEDLDYSQVCRFGSLCGITENSGLIIFICTLQLHRYKIHFPDPEYLLSNITSSVPRWPVGDLIISSSWRTCTFKTTLAVMSTFDPFYSWLKKSFFLPICIHNLAGVLKRC